MRKMLYSAWAQLSTVLSLWAFLFLYTAVTQNVAMYISYRTLQMKRKNRKRYKSIKSQPSEITCLITPKSKGSN